MMWQGWYNVTPAITLLYIFFPYDMTWRLSSLRIFICDFLFLHAFVLQKKKLEESESLRKELEVSLGLLSREKEEMGLVICD